MLTRNRFKVGYATTTFTRLATATTFATLAACGGGGGSDAELTVTAQEAVPPTIAQARPGALNASTDVTETIAGQPSVISLLNNDTFSSADGTELQLLGSPAHGSAQILPSGQIEYTADEDFEGTDTITYRLIDADGAESTGTVFLSVACASCELGGTLAGNSDQNGDEPATGAALPELQANPDSIEVNAGQFAAVSPMRNDSIADRSTVQFRVDADPTEGHIEAQANGIVVYQAPADFTGSDSIVYSIRDEDGNQSVASIDFTIACPLCGVSGIELAWPANAAEENIAGYRIYFGPDENEFTASMLREVRVTADGFDANAPSILFDAANELNLSNSEGGCFRISAIRGNEESAQSQPACFTLG